MILVVGATGDLGGRITNRLLSQGKHLRLLARPGPHHHGRLPRATERVVADLKAPESLAAACHGVDTVVTTATASARTEPDGVDSVDLTGNLNLIEAAQAAGVSRFVFVSALGAHPEHPMPLLRAKGVAEQRLRASDMAWTVLQPNVFMDKLIPIVVGEPAMSNRPVTLVGSGRRKHTYIAMDDVAAYACAALTNPHAHRQTVIVAGPDPVSWYDIVTAFENELQRSLRVHNLPPGPPAPDLPDFVTQLLTALDGYDTPIDMTQTSSDFGIAPTHLADYIHAYASNLPRSATG